MKQPRCPAVVCAVKPTMHTMGYYSANEKKESNDRRNIVEESQINHALRSQIQNTECQISHV